MCKKKKRCKIGFERVPEQKEKEEKAVTKKICWEKTDRLGRFYGVGVGPGDPGLVTLKAVDVMKRCKVIAIAVSSPGLKEPVYEKACQESANSHYLDHCVAYQIALSAVPQIAQKAKLYLPMPMIRDKALLSENHGNCAKRTKKILRKGKDVAFITLGDPTVYSTCLYVHRRLKRWGYRTSLVPGVPSFCAAAAKLNMSLAENRQELHIIPASYEIEEALEMPGTKVLMKAGTRMSYVKQAVKEKGLKAQMVEKCGLPGERIYRRSDQIPDKAGYYSLVIVKEGR